ncbi:MAG: 16S rRNA (cytosine(1402)-N(4))-methyltransferase RsmH [Candidatus Doudnabacteria bacterium]|nr:16S rRNA (cytosine(1402)-N(4))-methyltransferase RsmH [Candidatus Doudnabacteria bacterium]
MTHYPVLADEAMQYVGAADGSMYIDATAGAGGHTKAILSRNKKARVLCLDRDSETLEKLEREFKQDGLSDRVKLVHSNYVDVEEVALREGFSEVSGVILDLGFSSMQLDDSERGFSFQSKGPLDMRFDRKQNLTAADVLNKYQEEKLAEIFKKYGEENFSKRIARNVVVHRKVSPLAGTDEVFRLIRQALPGSVRHKANDSARRIFQALRIEVNDELKNLERALPIMVDLLAPKGRIVVISFHSLEDRIVKNFFATLAKGCICPLDFPECVCGKNPIIKILTKKPVTATEAEIKQNPRSKPAKLRAAEKI